MYIFSIDLIKNLHKEYKRQNPVLAHHTTPFQNSDPMSQSTPRVDLKESRVTMSGSTTHQTLITVGSGMKGYGDGELPEKELCEGQ